MSTITDRIGNLEIRDNSAAAHAERLPYEVYDLEHPNHNHPILVATFSNRVDAVQYASTITGDDLDQEDDDCMDGGQDDFDESMDGAARRFAAWMDGPDEFDESMDGDFDSGMASAG